MAKERKGSIRERDGKVYARVTFYGVDGKRKDRERKAQNRTHARLLIKEMLRELEEHGERTIDSANMTFNELAAYCIEHYFHDAVYDSEGRKLAGVRGLQTALSHIKPLKETFGRKRLRDITHGDIMTYRVARLKGVTVRGTKRSIATVNRELSKLRRMLNIAEREGWIIKNPFRCGDSLISVADERIRERILTPEEERRLLSACEQPTRRHLKALIIAALDTGARQGELLQLVWDDVDVKNRIITVTSYKGKTVQRREVYITTRLLLELEDLKQSKPVAAFRRSIANAPKPDENLVFGVTNNVKWSYRAAKKEAGLEGVRFHDLRHSAATRMVSMHIPLPEVGRVLGHSNPTTTYRYTNAHAETVKRAGLALETFHQANERTFISNQPETEKELVN